MSRRILMLALCAVASGYAAEGGATIKPAPGFEPPKASPPSGPVSRPAGNMVLGRPQPGYEVDSLVITPGDPAGLAAWAALAAQGFHVVGVLAQDGKQVLLLERMANPGSTDMRLPSAVAADPAQAAALQARLQAIRAERQAAAARPMPAPAPAPAVEAKP